MVQVRQGPSPGYSIGMSEKNAEIVRRSWQAYAERGLPGLFEFFTEDINWRAIEGAIDDVGEMSGIDAMRRYLSDWVEMFADITATPTEVLDLGDDQVLAMLRVEGTARLSGVATELSYAVLYTLRDGKIARGREFAERQEALDAAQLEG